MTIFCFLLALAAWFAGYLVGGYRPRLVERFPMATAPRDGTMIRLWFHSEDEATVGWYLVDVGIDAPPPGVHILPCDDKGGPAWWAPL